MGLHRSHSVHMFDFISHVWPMFAVSNIHKASDDTMFSNYRPDSVSAVYFKLLEPLVTAL